MTDLIANLTSDPRNARTHGERNLALIESALREVGAARSVVVDEDGVVLAGNATLAAATRAGLTRVRIIDTDGTELVAVRRSGLSDAQKRKLALYDNRADELADLLGSLDEFLPLLADPDDVPDLGEAPVTQSGDRWLLGSHRLVCGDATKPEDLAALMEGELAACLWTDPPYGVSYVGKTKDALTIANDDAAGLAGLLRASFTAAQTVLAPGAAFYIAHPAGPLSLTFLQIVSELGWKLRQTLVWVKDGFVLGHADYHYRHEPILFGYLPGGVGRLGRGGAGWYGDDAQDSVFAHPKPHASPDHPTSKPVALVEAMLVNSTKKHDLVLDPFGGSGSTLIACETLGRQARLLELDPRYCDVIVRRWETVTGQIAERVAG